MDLVLGKTVSTKPETPRRRKNAKLIDPAFNQTITIDQCMDNKINYKMTEHQIFERQNSNKENVDTHNYNNNNYHSNLLKHK